MTTLLKVKSLKTVLEKENESISILSNISFELKQREIIGIIGESGSGKTQTALSILNLIPRNIHIENGEVLFDNLDLLKLPPERLRHIRGKKIAMILQESLSNLNPLLSSGYQIMETILSHENILQMEAKERTLFLLKKVGFENPDNIFTLFPHQMSGGMRQRILIAIAISCNPEILIADEPTSSLDIVSDQEILALIKNLNKNDGMSIIFITHNLELIKNLADYILVMQNSEIVERGTIKEIFDNPKHNFTKELLNIY